MHAFTLWLVRDDELFGLPMSVPMPALHGMPVASFLRAAVELGNEAIDAELHGGAW